MQNKKIKGLKLIKHYNQAEIIKKIYKFLILNFFCKKVLLRKKVYFIYFLLKSRQYFSFQHKTKLTLRCILTNKKGNVNQFYNISRSKFRELLQTGIISGYRKAVW